VELEDLVLIHTDVPTPEHELYEDDDGSVPDIVLDIDRLIHWCRGESPTSWFALFRYCLTSCAKCALEGTANPNPIHDTQTYKVEFDDEELALFSANLTAEHMCQQCDLHNIK
jgi:hypothetical protein